MKVRLGLDLRFGSARLARIVAQAVGVDNEGFLAMRIGGRRIEAEIEADSIGRALNTADDLLAAVAVAQKTSAVATSGAHTATTGKKAKKTAAKQKKERREKPHGGKRREKTKRPGRRRRTR